MPARQLDLLEPAASVGATPEDYALEWIGRKAQCGQTLEEIRRGQEGFRGADKAIQIGGYVLDPAETGTDKQGRILLRRLKADECAVTRFAGEDGLWVFSLTKLYREARDSDTERIGC